jgi:cell division septum initiation protein DivIVA
MALSFSRPDPSSPSAVAAATFTSTRRGFEPNEVRELLRMVAAELARLQEREKFLEREVRTAQRGASGAGVALDDEMVTRMLGEEAARILSTAREAASQIKIRAEESAARVLREASDEAQRMREEATIESARRRQDAASDAESEIQMAKQQGREMVNEARAYRERVLSELSRRREVARQQIEQLLHGRDRLLQSFERARLSAVDVMAELTPLGEPSEYVNLAPITGPVPLMVPADQLRADFEPEPVLPDQPVDDTADQVAAEALDAPVVDAPVDDAPADGAPAHDGEVVEVEEPEMSNVVSLFAGEVPDRDAGADSDTTEPKGDVDELFARLRAARVAQVAASVTSTTDLAPSDGSSDAVDATTELTIRGEDLAVFQASPVAPDEQADVLDSPFGHRDAVLTPVIVAAARRMKRVLADEQNEVLAALRRNDQVRTLDTLLPWPADHAERYTAAIHNDLQHAAMAGAASISSASKSHLQSDLRSAKALKPAEEYLAANLVEPLRARLERAVADAADNDELGSMVRTIYREWKTQRIDEHLEDTIRLAFGRGQLAAVTPGASVCWMVDPNGPACPDAEDNALAGAVVAGDPFPTEHTFAPAHAGCKCMLAPVTS